MPRSNWARNARLPVISPRAVDTYLNRTLNSYDFLKTVPKAELANHVKQLGHRFASDPWHHQLACFIIGTQLSNFLYFLKMGGGKTAIALNLMRYRKRLGQFDGALVLAPELMHVASWEEQIKTHAPDLQYRLLLGEKNERAAQLDKKADVYVINYAGLLPFMTVHGKKKGKGAQLIEPNKAGTFASMFNFLVFDELHRIANHNALYHDLFRWLSAAATFRYALDGTPHGRDPTPLFGHFRLIDQGETFGPTLGMFRQAFFTPKKDYWAGLKWTFDKDKTGDLNRVIKNRSISYELTELHDMPRKLPIGIPVRLRGEGLAYYNRILKNVKEARGDYRSLGNLYVRMRQCASGFLALRADDESRIEVEFKDNPKLDALHEFLISRPDEKVLVFHEFIHSGRQIERMLEQAKIGHARLHGGMKDPGAEYHRFLEEQSCRVFVLQNRLGSEAINPQYVCRRAVFYESPDDPKIRAQAEARVHRPGQKWTTFIHDMLVLDTVEEKIKRYNQEGESLLAAVLSGRETLGEE